MEKIILESIADKLLDRSITCKTAKKLIDELKNKNEKNFQEEKYYLEEGENHLKIFDENEREKAYIEFYFDIGCMEEKFIQLNKAESFEEGKGHFKRLFKRLKKIGKREKAECILLEVDYSNDRAISIYEYLGFYQIGEINSCSDNIDRIKMRKDLYYIKD